MLKKLILGFASGIMLFSSTVFASDIRINMNGEPIEFTNQQPVIIDEEILIPLRYIFEKIGYTVSYDQENKKALAANGKNEFIVAKDLIKSNLNGEEYELNLSSEIINGSMMIPLSVVGQAVEGYAFSFPEDKKGDIFVLTEDEKAEGKAYYKKAEDIIDSLSDLIEKTSYKMLECDLDLESILADEDYTAAFANLSEKDKTNLVLIINEFNSEFKKYTEDFSKIEAPQLISEYHEKIVYYLTYITNLLSECVDFIEGKTSSIEDIIDKYNELEELDSITGDYFSAIECLFYDYSEEYDEQADEQTYEEIPYWEKGLIASSYDEIICSKLKISDDNEEHRVYAGIVIFIDENDKEKAEELWDTLQENETLVKEIVDNVLSSKTYDEFIQACGNENDLKNEIMEKLAQEFDTDLIADFSFSDLFVD